MDVLLRQDARASCQLAPLPRRALRARGRRIDLSRGTGEDAMGESECGAVCLLARFAAWLRSSAGWAQRRRTAAPATGSASRFGAREHVEQVSLSPDGAQHRLYQRRRRARHRGPGGRCRGAARAEGRSRADGEPERLVELRLGLRRRLVCTLYGVIGDISESRSAFTRLVAIDADGGQTLNARPQEPRPAHSTHAGGGDVIDWLPGDGSGADARDYVPRSGTGTPSRDGATGSASSWSTRSTRRAQLDRAAASDASGLSQPTATARSASCGQPRREDRRLQRRTPIYYYRRPAPATWKPLEHFDASDGASGFDRSRSIATLNVAYGFEAADGRARALQRRARRSMKRDWCLRDPRSMSTGWSRIGRQRRVVGATYVTERRETEYLRSRATRRSAPRWPRRCPSSR